VKLSSDRLLQEANATGFRPESLEKVLRLIGLLNAIFRIPELASRLALKGGTALNLFLFDLPRLSVDIDLNYIGSADLKVMEEERPWLETRLRAVFEGDDFAVRRAPTEHAGGKWMLRYLGAQGQGGNLEVDLNWIHRVSLEPIQRLDSRPLGSFIAKSIPTLDLHELAAGKLAALLDRSASRDIFDASGLFEHLDLDFEKLRLTFVVMGAMSRTMDLRKAHSGGTSVAEQDFRKSVEPLLRVRGPKLDLVAMQEACRAGLGKLLPLRPRETAFLDALLDRGEIHPEYLTEDASTQGRIRTMPMLLWKAQPVRHHKGITLPPEASEKPLLPGKPSQA